MKRLILILANLLVLFLFYLAIRPDSADFMRSIGKIYVVIAVILIIFISIVFYLVRLDNKLTKLENQINQHE